MSYINTETGEFNLTAADIMARHPNVSFPSPFVPPPNYAPVHLTNPPPFNAITHAARELTPVVSELRNYEQAWEIIALDAATVAANQARQAEQDFAAAKAQRATLVEQIKVTTTAGHEFDGDEVSQGRMARAIIALSAAGGTVNWVLADNSIAQVTAAELTEALALAGAAQAAIWVAPYAPAA